MNKYFEKWNGKKFPVRVVSVDAEYFGYSPIKVADYELWSAIQYHVEQLRDLEAGRIDNDIYFYCKSRFIESDPTDEEIVDYLIKNGC